MNTQDQISTIDIKRQARLTVPPALSASSLTTPDHTFPTMSACRDTATRIAKVLRWRWIEYLFRIFFCLHHAQLIIVLYPKGHSYGHRTTTSWINTCLSIVACKHSRNRLTRTAVLHPPDLYHFNQSIAPSGA